MKSYHKPVHLPQNDPRLTMVRHVTKLMDEQFTIGKFKFGIDPLLNLIPFAGNFGTYIISITLIITMIKHGASSKVAAKMVANATLDAIIGFIPVLGWIFDFTYKANTRNLKLLSEHYTLGKHKGSAKSVIIFALLTMIIILGVLIYLSVTFLQWIIDKFNQWIF